VRLPNPHAVEGKTLPSIFHVMFIVGDIKHKNKKTSHHEIRGFEIVKIL
jgi:hypothetical protein